ncbi:heat-shock protein [Marivivens niveibacter]|uniref:Heat-shock protein n=1 Tax=Marivivens niveibacter TaxID=1930667 RepID=A0A251WXB9_9RHOB|nr:Hsp20 family protein [Marivivens niveibacter]OUD09022.1 heat-shock protein [Marivivens niveibacter]
MRSFDLAPLYRATVGYDQIADLMDRVMTNDSPNQSYPPYNIEKTDEQAWRVTLAVAGFAEDDLTIELRENTLFVSGAKDKEPETTYLHRGIATRAFNRRFHLADHVQVTNAALENGLLHIDLKREVPEALKPRRIAISKASQTIENEPLN